jgi:ankyrin repeat protein
MPLHLAAQNGHAAVTEKLIAARCNVDLQQQDGCFPTLIPNDFSEKEKKRAHMGWKGDGC